MAGRWRSQQRRKRWTDHAAFLPTGTVSSVAILPELDPLVKQLTLFEAQPSIYAQLTQVKPLGKVFLSLLPELQLNERALEICVKTFLEILFVDNSRPLHRGLLSTLSHVPQEYSTVLRTAFQTCCKEYGPGGPRERKFAVVAVAASLAGLPQPGVMKDVAQNSIFYTGNAACHDVRGVLQHAVEGGRPTPTIMEEAQNALSSIYYLLQQFPSCFSYDETRNSETAKDLQQSGKVPEAGLDEESNGNNKAAEDLFGAVVSLLLDVLQTSVLSRDCVVAAGVGLAAAAQLHAENEGLSLLLTRMAFPSSYSLYRFCSLTPDTGLMIEQADGGILEGVVVKIRGSSLCSEMEKFSEFGKLCLFRGILTAVPRTTLNAILLRVLLYPKGHSGVAESVRRTESSSSCPSELSVENNWQVWTLLYDGILPALCAFCESSVDSHFKFHAVTALQICLQQIKTSICGNLTHSLFSEFVLSARGHDIIFSAYVPLTAAIVSRVLQLIWNNWEDPLTQTVKQVQLVFDLLVDVQLVYKSDAYSSQVDGDSTGSSSQDSRRDSFLYQIASDLLAAGRYRKGKYVPLASLVQRIGARRLLGLKTDLLFQTIHAFSDDDVCCAASTFYKSFLERLREDCWSTEGVMKGTIAARRLWIPAILSGLLSGDSRLRNNLTTYALPAALQIDCDSLLVMLDYILDGHCSGTGENFLGIDDMEGANGLPRNLSIDQQVVLLISLLKVARTTALALVDGAIGYTLKPSDKLTARYEREVEDELVSSKVLKEMSHAVFMIKGQAVDVHVNLLLAALTHEDDGLRVDATELMCLNPKTASMPSPLELCLLRIALPLNMRCSSTSFRMRWTSFIRKFFQHVRSSVERVQKANTIGKSQQATSLKDVGREDTSKLAVSVSDVQEFMQWLSQMLISSLYPSAPYERKNMAMELFYALIQVWSLNEFCGHRHLKTLEFSPYHRSLLSADSTLVVVGAIVDSWDKLRENAYRILVCYPTPLPGLDSECKVERLLRWAKSLAISPRVRESDAGALALRLIFRKYVVELGWVVKIHPEPHVLRSPTSCENGSSCLPGRKTGETMVQYFEALNDWLQWGIEEGDKDLLRACKQSFVHGVLLVLRYTVDEVDWTSASVQSSGGFRATFERLLALLLRVTSLALWVVSADALILKSKLEESPAGTLDAGSTLTGLHSDRADVDDEYDSDVEESLAPAEQIVMVGCWLSVKEVSLLLGTIARSVPLPGYSSGEPHERMKGTDREQTGNSETNNSNVMLDGKQLEAIGSHFLQVLLSMKHNGAIDKTRTGFIALCDRLLRSSDPWLSRMPELWLQQLMKHTGAKGQVVDDLLRRSAGIPPAFLALFLAEPDGAPKKILPMGMRWLLNTCKGYRSDANAENQTTADDPKGLIGGVVRVKSKTNSTKTMAETDLPKALKSRDEGVVPTVHAFNVLRVAFHDTNLATDTSGYCAEGLVTAVQAFASSHWEIRNAATLAFSALVHRMIGFLNVYQRESARRAITGFEFFHRYPTLHPFLLEELRSATWQLEHGPNEGQDKGDGLARSLHPSLAPVLIILSRLKPSFINSDVEDWLNPSAFMPYVSQCATQRNLQVRVLASRALPPLVSSEDLFGVLVDLARSLPSSKECKTVQQTLRSTDRSAGGVRVAGLNMVQSYNAIHGVLLQMHALFTSSCVSLPDRDVQGQIVTHIFDVIKDCSWLGSIIHCSCSIVVGAFLDMLGGLLELAEVYLQDTAIDPQSICNKLRQLLRFLTHDCLEDSVNGSPSLLDPTRIRLRERATKLFFQAIFTQGFPEEDEALGKVCTTLERTLSDASYEVRLITLKVLKQYCRFPNTTASVHPQGHMPAFTSSRLYNNVTFLRPVIIYRLRTETHPLCIRRVLQLIYSWSLMDRRDLGTESSGQACSECSLKIGTSFVGESSVWGSSMSTRSLWYTLLKIYSSSKQVKTKEASVRCLGGSLQQVRSIVQKLTSLTDGGEASSSSDEEERWEYVKDVLSTWLVITKKHSSASESVNFRRAIAEAIVASGLLEDTDWVGKGLAGGGHGDRGRTILEEYGKTILSLWCTTIKLLEDEDLDLRQNLSLEVLNVITISGSVPDVVPAQVEKVIQVSFDFLSSRLGTWREYFSVLSEWLIGSNIDFSLNNSNGDLVRRLFDKEIDNHHEEELLFVQLCCSHLEKFISFRLKQKYFELEPCSVVASLQELSLQSWRMRHLSQAKLCAEFSVQSLNSIQWVGGVTNHQDTFKSLYRSLLGLLTFSGYREGVGLLWELASTENLEILHGLVELTALLKEVSLNPLVSNVLLRVLASYEHQLGRGLGSEEFRNHLGNAFITNFEPLFLIR